MADLREIYSRGPEEEEGEMKAGSGNIKTTTRSSVKKKHASVCWQETIQRVLTAQELGNNYIHTVTRVT